MCAAKKTGVEKLRTHTHRHTHTPEQHRSGRLNLRPTLQAVLQSIFSAATAKAPPCGTKGSERSEEPAPEPLGKAMASGWTRDDVRLPEVGQYIESRGCISYTAPYPRGVMLKMLEPGCILGPIRDVHCNQRFCAVRIRDAWINTWGSRPRPTNFASVIPRAISDTWRDGTVGLVDPQDGRCYELGSDVSSTSSRESTQLTVCATAAATEGTEDSHEKSGEQCNESSISSERIGAAALGNVCLGCSRSCLTCRRRGPRMHPRSRSLPP